MRQSSLSRAKYEKESPEKLRQMGRNANGQQVEGQLNEEINANTLMLFYHPLFQETTKRFLQGIFQKESNEIQIKFFQFIELNLRIQKALIEQFQIDKAIVSALNDWNRELTLLNVQSHSSDQNNMKAFDLKFHYDSIHELQMGASFSVTNYAKLLDSLKEHKSFQYSEYCISIEVFQKFLFDISCNWCQFYDIEIFCFFINSIFLQITKGYNLRSCQVKSLNQITYLSSLFFKEFNQVKHVYSRYIKKNLKTNFKVWCEWNFQRLNDICQSLLVKLGRIFSQDPRTAEYSFMFKDALDNFNKEIVQSAARTQISSSPEQNSTNIVSALATQGDNNNELYATYMKGGQRKMQFIKKINSQYGNQRIEENHQGEDEIGSSDNIILLERSYEMEGEAEEEVGDAKRQNVQEEQQQLSDKKKQITNGQIALNEIEKKIMQKKLKQMNKLLEKQKNEIDQDSNSLKAAYRQAEKSNSNAFKYFQKLLHYKREQQKKFLKGLPYAISNKSSSPQQELSPSRDQQERKVTDSQINNKNKQIIEDFYMCNQGKFNLTSKVQNEEGLIGEYQSNLKLQNFSDLSSTDQMMSSQYQGKQRFMTNQSIRKSQDYKMNQPVNQQNGISPQSQANSRQNSANAARNIIQWGQTSFKEEDSQDKQHSKSNNSSDFNDQLIPLDLHKIALSKAHQISPSRQRESGYDSNVMNSPYRIHTYHQTTSNVQQNKILQHNKLQPMPLVSPKISDSQFYSQKVSHNNSNSNLHTTVSNQNSIALGHTYQTMYSNQDVEKRQITESKLYTTQSDYDQSPSQPMTQTRNQRIHSEQDYIFRNTSHDSKQPQNLFNKNMFNSTKQKKKISLGDIINLNYLYKPSLTFSGTSTAKKNQTESHDLQLEIKPLRPETTQQQPAQSQNSEIKYSGQKVRSQTVGLNEVYPSTQAQITKQSSNSKQLNTSNNDRYLMETKQLNNSNIYLKPIQPQFTQKYRKLVSQSRYLWQKHLVEDDLYQINDYDRLNNFLDELKNTKSNEQIRSIIFKYTQSNQPNDIQSINEKTLFQFKIPYNRKAEVPLMQGKNMKLATKL